MDNSSRGVARNFRSSRDHNLPPVGKVLPRQRFAAHDVAKGQGAVLRAVFGRLKSPAKEQARLTGQSERAARNQQAGLNCMALSEFFNACQTVPELQAWGLEMMGALRRGDAPRQDALQRGYREIVLRIDVDGAGVAPPPARDGAAIHDLFERRRA